MLHSGAGTSLALLHAETIEPTTRRTPILKVLLPITAIALLTGCIIVVGEEYRDQEDLAYELRTLELAAADLDGLVATAGAGSFELIGEEGRDNVDVSAEIRYADPDDIRLSLERQGTEARLIADMRNDSRHGGWAHINMVVRMPANLDLDLEDGSGAITISGLRSSLLVNDGSGSLQIDGGAALTLKDGSGAIEIAQISGDVFIDDGSGEIQVRDIGGTVTIKDGSGAISVRGAGGLNILESGSGGVEIKDVRGPVDL